MNYAQHLRDTIRQARATGASMGEIASRAGIGREYLSRLAHGYEPGAVSTATRVAEACAQIIEGARS